jgi:cell division protein FtsZ
MSAEQKGEEEESVSGIKLVTKQPKVAAETPQVQSQSTANVKNTAGQSAGGMNNDERIRRLKNLSMKLNNQKNIEELEKEPAYLRRGVDLDSVPHSSESGFGSYTLTKDSSEEKPELRQNNSFLHDQVD